MYTLDRIKRVWKVLFPTHTLITVIINILELYILTSGSKLINLNVENLRTSVISQLLGIFNFQTSIKDKYNMLIKRNWRYYDDIIKFSKWWSGYDYSNGYLSKCLIYGFIYNGISSIPTRNNYCWLPKEALERNTTSNTINILMFNCNGWITYTGPILIIPKNKWIYFNPFVKGWTYKEWRYVADGITFSCEASVMEEKRETI